MGESVNLFFIMIFIYNPSVENSTQTIVLPPAYKTYEECEVERKKVYFKLTPDLDKRSFCMGGADSWLDNFE